MRRKIHRLSSRFSSRWALAARSHAARTKKTFAKTVATVRTGAAVTGSGLPGRSQELVEGGVRGGFVGPPFDDYFAVAPIELHLPRHHRHISGLRGQTRHLDQCLARHGANVVRHAPGETGGVRRRSRDAGAKRAFRPACTFGRDCEAHCFLSQVADVCARSSAELSNFRRLLGQLPSLRPRSRRHGRPKKSMHLMSAKRRLVRRSGRPLSNQGAQPCKRITTFLTFTTRLSRP